MIARRMIEAAAYGPHQLKALSSAFDDAWEAVAPTVGGGSTAVEAARLQLANIVLSLARNGNLDAPRLADAAVRLMSASPPHR
jgi:hypothetical protein